IAFLSLQENFDTSTPFGKAMIGILSVFAQLEREQIKERMMLGKVGRAKAGKNMAWINPAFGYDYDTTTQKTTVIPSQALVIQRIFDEYIKGKPIAKIAEDLNKEGKHG
ncbi:recombinase family protein, partial [Streptococcus suis]